MADEAPRTPLVTMADPTILIGRLSAKNKEFRMQRDQALEATKKQQADIEQMTATVADLKKQLDESSSAKVMELEQKLRDVQHRRAFEALAKAKGVRDDAFDAAWQLSGYKPETDVIDEAVISASLDTLKERHVFLFGPIPPEQRPPKPGVASGQGSRAAGNSTGFELPADDDPRWNDPVWQWKYSTEISDAINERLKNGHA